MNMYRENKSKIILDYCENCGILLFEETKGKQLCKACKLANDELKNHTKACVCQYCMRSYDWNNKDFEKPFNLHQYPTRSTEDAPRALPTRYEDAVDQELRKRWEKEQMQLKKQLQTEDSDLIRRIRQKIEQNKIQSGELYIAGVDISFIKGDNVNACSAFVVLNYPDLEVVYEDYKMIKLTAPYIPGFLAFREVEFIVEQYRELERTHPEYLPQVICVDGNGVLHPRGFGLASHLGVLLGVASLGVAKTLIHVDGLEDNEEHKAKKSTLKKGGDTFLLQTTSGLVLGKALRSCDSAQNPVYVSQGHMISLDTAVLLVSKCSKFRIPEPTRKADLNSREYLRVHHPQGCQA